LRGGNDPTCEETADLVPQELHKLAREWKKRADTVMTRLESQ
jgi:hypothetical protein